MVAQVCSRLAGRLPSRRGLPLSKAAAPGLSAPTAPLQTPTGNKRLRLQFRTTADLNTRSYRKYEKKRYYLYL